MTDARTSRNSSQARIPAAPTRYLAEGATGSFFSTRVAVANPGTAPAQVLLRYQTDTGQTTSTLLTVPGRARRFVNVGTVPSLASASFSTVVESDQEVIVDRSMFWSTGYFGSHAETSVAAPSTTWFLAEGVSSCCSRNRRTRPPT